MIDNSVIEKAKRLGSLLASSPMSDTLKDSLIANVPSLSEEAIDRVIEALESEQEFLDHLERELRSYTIWQEEEWQKLAMLQSRVAEDLLEDEIKELERQAKVDELRQGASQ